VESPAPWTSSGEQAQTRADVRAQGESFHVEMRWRRDGDAMETRTAYSAGGCTLTRRAVVHGQALVSFLVSFIYVLRRSAHTIYNERSRLHTVLNYSGPWRADLASVWVVAATRTGCPQQLRGAAWRAQLCAPTLEGSSSVGLCKPDDAEPGAGR